MKTILSGLFALALLPSAAMAADPIVIPMNRVDEQGVGTQIGEITVTTSPYGLVFSPALRDLAPGIHGFHVHQNPSCATTETDGKRVPAGGAGAHLDPAKTGAHGTPWGEGHLGDLPALYVDAQGRATQPVLAPRLKLVDLRGHALMVHVGGDNHSDHPAPLGGGGARTACGVVPGA